MSAPAALPGSREPAPRPTPCGGRGDGRRPACGPPGLPAAHPLRRKGERAAALPCRRPGLALRVCPLHLLASSAPTGVLGARGWGVSRGTHASQPPPLRVPWVPHPQRGKSRRWVWLCRCRGPEGGRPGSAAWTVLPLLGGNHVLGPGKPATQVNRTSGRQRGGCWPLGESARPVGAVMGTVLCGGHADFWGPGAHVHSPTHTGTCLHTDTCLPSHTQLSRSHTCALMHTYPYSRSCSFMHTCSRRFTYSSCPPCSLHSHTHT